jgi:hypothetical protein
MAGHRPSTPTPVGKGEQVRAKTKKTPEAITVVNRPRVFDNISESAKPCPVCLKLAKSECIQGRAVMPLPPFPARLKSDNSQCCRDCQATETAMAVWGIHPDFVAARLCVANERCEALTMPLGMAELFGMCKEGVVRPCSNEDLNRHLDWCERNGISISA